eukprot:TRINITY_DN81019_c0_g2_i2.p3 TRINITY_DN81019_c0_g2~~TRINITY_DN81019_c0_g2_i2.p3  ORF type:complete len:195 (+),score=12.52 TRINITY_DN81019_c0_g2_i2:112-696(+)
MLQRYLTDCVQLALGNWDREDLIKEIQNSKQIVQSVVQCSMDISATFNEIFPFVRSSEASDFQELPVFQQPVWKGSKTLELLNLSGNLAGEQEQVETNIVKINQNKVNTNNQSSVGKLSQAKRQLNKQMSVLPCKREETSQKAAQRKLLRCTSVPQTQTIGRGNDNYCLGRNKGSEDSDGAPVRNLIAFFERQN